MGTKLQELRDGCFARAMDDEEMFVLLARDVGAPAKVREWADERMDQIKRGERPAADMPQIQEAYGCADRMEAWREANDGAWRAGLFGKDQATDAALNREQEANELFDRRPRTGADVLVPHQPMGESRDARLRRGYGIVD